MKIADVYESLRNQVLTVAADQIALEVAEDDIFAVVMEWGWPETIG